MATETQTKELQEEIRTKTARLQSLVEPPDGFDMPDNPLDEIKSLSGEIRTLHNKRQTHAETAKAKELLDWMNEVDPNDKLPEASKTDAKDDAVGTKSAGELFTESPYFKNYAWGSAMPEVVMDRPLKALFQTSAGFEPESTRIPTIVGYIHRPIQLLDRIRQIPTSMPSILWMEQTIRTHPGSRGATAEGAPYREAAVQWAERSADIVKKTAFIPVTEEQFADVPFIQDIVTAQLPAMLGEIIDEDLVNGSAAAGQLIGLTSLTTARYGTGSGTAQTRTKDAGESFYAGIVRMIADIEINGRAMADMIIMHSQDYYEFMLTQDANLQYMFGLLGQSNQSPWGPPIVKMDAVPRGTVIVGDFARYMIIRDRQSYRTRVAPRWAVTGSVPADDGTNPNDLMNGLTVPTGQMNIFSDVRLQVTHLRPQAFNIGTGF